MTRKARSNADRIDIYQQVTDQIVEMLETGTKPWSPRWAGGRKTLPLRHCGTPYQGINILLLWSQAMSKGYANPYWMTFKQAQELGGNVRKGEKGSHIVYAGSISAKDEEGKPQDGDDTRRISFLKGYTVFNAEQIEGLPEGRFPAPLQIEANHSGERDEELEAFFAAYGVPISESGNSAFYDPASDAITMPHFDSFVSANAFYATLAHETIHSTGRMNRLNRETLRDYHKEKSIRAKEELIAEIGAALICAVLGMEATEREDHASYIASWIKCLKNDKRAIFQAATSAQSASNFIIERVEESQIAVEIAA